MSSDHHNGNGTGSAALRASELSYRRLLEAAKDGILILDVDTGRITDVNPFLSKLLGFSHNEMVGQTVGELSPFKDIECNQVMLERLQHDGFVRYEDLPLESKDGRKIAVEFVSNVYQAGDKNVIQCNVRDITGRKQGEAASIRLASIVDSSDDAIIGKDLNSIITSWNNGAKRIFGYTASEMVGTSVMRLIPSERQDEENQILTKIKRGESVKHFETLRQAKDGRLIAVSVTVSPIKDAKGKVIGVSKVARDISGQRGTEDALRESEAKFRALFDAAHDAIFLLHNGVIADCNASGLKLYGVTREQLIGQSPALVSPPTQPDGRDSQEKALEIIQRAMTGEPQVFEWVNQKSDGTPIYVDVSVSRFELRGEPYLQAIARDSTERKLAQNEKERVGRQMHLLLESAVEGIYGVDLEGRCTFINRAASEMLGCKAEQAMGRIMHELKHHHRKDGSAYPFEECPTFRALQNQESSHVEDEVYWRADGTSFPVEYDSRPILDGATVIGAVITFTDITERKKAEEILRSVSKSKKGRQNKKVFTDLGVIVFLSALVFVTAISWDCPTSRSRMLRPIMQMLAPCWMKRLSR